MKALVLTGYNHFDYSDVPEPEVGPRDVLIRVRASGICGSDVHGMDGSSGRRLPPTIWPARLPGRSPGPVRK